MFYKYKMTKLIVKLPPLSFSMIYQNNQKKLVILNERIVYEVRQN
jgi:hypothetical protein